MEEQLQLLWQVQQLEQECKLWEKRKNHITLQEANALWEEVNKMTQSIVVKKEVCSSYRRYVKNRK